MSSWEVSLQRNVIGIQKPLRFPPPTSYSNTSFFMSRCPKPHTGSPWPQDKVWTPLPGESRWQLVGTPSTIWWTSGNIILSTLTLPQCGQWRKWNPRDELTNSQSWPSTQLGFLIWVVLCFVTIFSLQKDRSSMRVGKMPRFSRNTTCQGSRRRKCRVLIRHVGLCSQTGFRSWLYSKLYDLEGIT